MKLLDTTFLIDVLRGEEKTKKILQQQEFFLTTQINIFEILKGFFHKKSSPDKLIEMMELFHEIRVLPLDDMAVIRAAELSGNLSAKGVHVPASDCLIAGSALSKGVNTIITNNTKHFKRFVGITVEKH